MPLESPLHSNARNPVLNTLESRTPESVLALQETVQQLSQDRKPFAPIGSGSKFCWGQSIRTESLTLLQLTKLNHLVDHAVGDLTVTVQAGMKFAELQSKLTQAGQCLAIDPGYSDQATIGGIIATGDSGALRHRYNSVRDMVLGIEFIRADGAIAKAGGRVVKNVAGYDLMKLMTGSYGSLGILTQVTLRLYPLQESSQTVFLTGDSAKLSQLMRSILNSGLTPMAIDLFSSTVSTQLNLGSQMGLLIRFQGLAESVQEQVRRVIEAGQNQGLDMQSIGNTEADLWQQLGQLFTPPETAETQVLCKWAVRSTETADLLTQLQQICPTAIARFHGGEALPTVDELRQWRSIVESRGGFLTLLEAPDSIKNSIDVWGYRGNGQAWMRSIQQQFDPIGLLSPGRLT